MQSVVNPDTGERLYLVDNQWVPPSQTATNPETGQTAHLVGNTWQIVPPAPISPEPSILAGTKLPENPPPMTNEKITDVGKPNLSEVPQIDVSQMPTAEERAKAEFGLSPEMDIGEKALRTAKGVLYDASTGLEQTWLGGARMISDITGLGKEGVTGASKQLSKEQQAVQDTYKGEYGLNIAKNIGSSVIQNIPVIATGMLAGNTAALTNMWVQSFMQTYDDSRNEGLGVGASTVRSALYGTAEALGESLALPNLMKGVRDVMKGVPAAQLAGDLAHYLVGELSGEELTYVSQFLVDKGFNMNPEAGLKEFLQGAQDTALVTIGQTALMGGSGFTANKIIKELRKLHSKGDEGIPNAPEMIQQAPIEPPKGEVTVEQAPPEFNQKPTPPKGALVTPEELETEEPPAAPAPIGKGEPKTPEIPAVTPVTAEKPTFDEWRTKQGFIFGSKEEYEAALPKLKAQYEAEAGSVPIQLFTPKVINDPNEKYGKTAEFDKGNAYVTYVQDKDGNIRVSDINAEDSKNVSGREILKWLKDTYKKPIIANEVDPPAVGFWKKMQKEGLIDDWHHTIYDKGTKPLETKDDEFVQKPENIPEEAKAPVEAKEEPKAVQVQPTKELRGVNAAEVPLHEFHQGILFAMNKEKPNPAIASDDAIKLLKANDLVKENKDGTLELLPKGNSLLNDIREFTKPMGKKKSADEQKALFSKFIPQIETGEVVAKPKAAEAVKEPVEEELPKHSQAKDVPVIPEGEKVDSTDPKNLEKFNEIMETYEPQSGHSQESSFLDALNADVKSKQEKIEAPPFKKGYSSDLSLEVAPFNGGWVGGSRIMNNTGGYASGVSIWDTVYPTKQDAINAQIDTLRKSAETYDNKKAIAWLNSIDPRLTKEGKIETNKKRQAEKKAKAEPKPAKETPTAEEQRELERRDSENQIGKPALRQRLESGFAPYIDVTDEAGKKTYYAKGVGSIESKYQVKLDLTPEELRNAKIAEGDIELAQTLEERQEAKNQLEQILKPAAERAVSIETPLVVEKEKKKPTKEGQIEINKKRQAEKKTKVKEKPAVKEVPKAKPTSEEEQLIQDAVMYAKAANRTNLDEAAIRDKVENAKIKDPATVLTLLKNSVENLKKDAKTYVIREASDDYNDQIGQRPGKDSQIVDAIKGGALNIEGKPYAEAFYKIFNVKPEKIKKAAGETPVEKQLVKFESNVFSTADVKPEVYKEAAIKFLESPLTSPVPKANQGKLDVTGIEDVKPLPIEKKSYPKAVGFEGQVKALDSIAAPEGEIRYYLKGIHLDDAKKRMVATDGHRMAIINNADFKGMPAFKGTGDKIIGRDGKYMEGQYPQVDRVIENNKVTGKPIVVNSTELGDYARGVKKGWRYASRDKYSAMQIKAGDEILGFNSEYMEDMANLFKTMGYDTFNVQISKNKAMVATSPDGKVMQIIMSMRDPSPLFAPFNFTKGKAKTETMKTQPSIDLYEKKSVKERLQEIHDEKINEYARIRQRKAHLTRKVAEGKVSLGLQRELNDLLELEKELKQDVKLTTPKNNTAEHFYKRALDEYTKGNITKDVLDVVKYFYDNSPDILNGIKLSVRQTDEEGVMGNFTPLQRIVTLYKGLGADSPGTARHEIMHSLEQMMNSQTREAVIESWRGALENAIKQHSDDIRSSKYFNAVLDFINVPNDTNFKRAVSIMPSKDFYQFINPSEYWAVNAEKLMAAKMGTPWAKFVKFVKGLAERLKAMFGLENDHAIHKAFNDLIKGEKKRMDKESLTSYLNTAASDFNFLNDVKDVDDLLEKHNRNDAPVHSSPSVTDRLLGGFQDAKNIKTKLIDNPKGAVNNMVGTVDRALLSARIDTTDFTAGLTAADAARYGRELTDSEGRAIASVAMNQALKATRIGTQVIKRGKLDFDPKNQMFYAKDDKHSMANVLTLKHELENEIGKQRAANVIQAYFEAKRSKSIVQEYLDREAEYERLNAEQQDPNTGAKRHTELAKELDEAKKDLDNIKVALDKVNMDDEAIEDFIGLDKEYPQLKEMMTNWNAVNRNMIDMMEHSHIISEKRAETLRNIQDYVPWQRIQDEQTDPHAPIYGSKGVRNVSREHRFKEGKVDADIDDIVDNMLHNVMVTTRNSIKNYAANRIAQEYAVRNEKGKIKVYPKEDFEHGIVKILVNGKKINVKIADPLIAKSVIGIEHIQIPMNEILAFFSNGLRRSITFSGVFQVKQLFMDAFTAALVTGVKNPAALFGGVFGSFVKGLTQNDPIIQTLKSYGIGGYHSGARTGEHQYKQEIGLLNKSYMAKAASVLDQIADASDFAQRRAVYIRVMKETNGDQRKAILAATNVIDFDKRGAGRTAQFLNRTIAFMNAYAQQIDVLAQALAEPIAGGVEKVTGAKITSVSGNLKGLKRSEAIGRLALASGLLASTCLMYAMAVGDDDDYKKMDDQTKMRNFIIPKSLMQTIGYDHALLIPMHTSASYFFKSIPELLYNKITEEGTKDAIDNARLRKALKEGAVDALLGPLGSGPIPTAFKPGVEIAFNHNFFTGGTITPEGMKNLDPSRQYRGSTSELGKWFSAASGLGTDHRMLNPIEADHLMRSLGGSVAAIAMWGSNLFSGNRATPQEHDNILYGSFIAPDIARGREDLFYDLQGRTNVAMGTFKDLMKKDRREEAETWFKDHEGEIKAYGFTEAAGKSLQEINAQIRRLEDLPEGKMSPDEKRRQINFYKQKKEDLLEQTIKFRLSAGL